MPQPVSSISVCSYFLTFCSCSVLCLYLAPPCCPPPTSILSVVAMLEHMSRRSRSMLSLTLTTLALTLSILALCTSYWCEGTHKVVKPLCLSPVKMKNCGQNNSEPYTTGTETPSETCLLCRFILFFQLHCSYCSSLWETEACVQHVLFYLCLSLRSLSFWFIQNLKRLRMQGGFEQRVILVRAPTMRGQQAGNGHCSCLMQIPHLLYLTLVKPTYHKNSTTKRNMFKIWHFLPFTYLF